MHPYAYYYLRTRFHMTSSYGSLECHHTETHNKFPHDRHVRIFLSTENITISKDAYFFQGPYVSGAGVAPFSQVRSSATTFLLTAGNYDVRRQGVLQQHNGHT